MCIRDSSISLATLEDTPALCMLSRIEDETYCTYPVSYTHLVLRKIADRYEENTNRRLQSIIAVLEPTLVIILSVIVGLILLSVILPLMGIMTSIG